MSVKRLTSKGLDQLAAGPQRPIVVPAPAPGERCHRCHQAAPNLGGCALCNPDAIPRQPVVDPHPEAIDWDFVSRMLEAQVAALAAAVPGARLRVRLGLQLLNAWLQENGIRPALSYEEVRGRQLAVWHTLPVFAHPTNHTMIQVQAMRNDVAVDFGADL